MLPPPCEFLEHRLLSDRLSVAIVAIVLDLLRRVIVGIILILATVMLVVHVGSVLLSTVMSALFVILVHTYRIWSEDD